MITEMKKYSIGKVRSKIADVVNRATYGKERTIIVKHGKAVAAIVPFEDVEHWQKLEDQADVMVAKEALADARKNGTVPWEKVKAKLRKKK